MDAGLAALTYGAGGESPRRLCPRIVPAIVGPPVLPPLGTEPSCSVTVQSARMGCQQPPSSRRVDAGLSAGRLAGRAADNGLTMSYRKVAIDREIAIDALLEFVATPKAAATIP